MTENDSEDDQRLSSLMEEIVTSIQRETKHERANQIRLAIEFHLKSWLDGIENLNPLFKVSELIPAGSFAEGTKIIHPDEFDYLAVIDELSKPGTVTVDKLRENFNGALVRVAVADDKLKSKWKNLSTNGHLHCFQTVNFPRFDQKRFGHVFISLLWNKVNNAKKLRPTVGSPTDIACKIQLPSVNNISLFLMGADYKTPNVLIKFELNGSEITVDLSPAIRYYKIQDCFNVEDCAGPAFAELVLSKKSLLLIGTRFEFDFKVTVTEAELKYMQSVMKKEHKIIYIFLKYVVKLYEDNIFAITPFTSYMLKTVCIHHDIKCKTEKITVKECFKSVIEELSLCTQAGYVVSIVSKNVHLYPPYQWETVKAERRCMLDGMDQLLQMPRNVNTAKDLDVFLKCLVQQESKRRQEEERRQQQEWDQYNLANQDTCTSSAEGDPVCLQPDEEAMSQIIDMGFEPEEVRKAMSAEMNDPVKAVEYLLNISSKPHEMTVTESHAKGKRAPADREPHDIQNSTGKFSRLDKPPLSGGLIAEIPLLTCKASSSDYLSTDHKKSPETLAQSPSTNQKTSTCEIVLYRGPKHESSQSSSNEQNTSTCEILYQRQQDS